MLLLMLKANPENLMQAEGAAVRKAERRKKRVKIFWQPGDSYFEKP